MILLSAFLAIVAIYSRSVNGGFLFDDHAITDMHFERWSRAWKGDIYPDRRPRFRYAVYAFFHEPRSLTHIGYLWTWRRFGFSPFAYHAVNIGLHMANTCLVLLIGTWAIGPHWGPIAAFLFAVHPHQVAAVSYISGRANLQMTFFVLSAILCAINGAPFIAIIACMFAERSKEDGLLWLFLLAVGFGALHTFYGSI